MRAMTNHSIFTPSLKGVAMVTDYWRVGENLHTSPSSPCALAFHNGREDRNTDARVNTADEWPLYTSDKKTWWTLSSAGSFAPGELHAGLCHVDVRFIIVYICIVDIDFELHSEFKSADLKSDWSTQMDH